MYFILKVIYLRLRHLATQRKKNDLISLIRILESFRRNGLRRFQIKRRKNEFLSGSVIREFCDRSEHLTGAKGISKGF